MVCFKFQDSVNLHNLSWTTSLPISKIKTIFWTTSALSSRTNSSQNASYQTAESDIHLTKKYCRISWAMYPISLIAYKQVLQGSLSVERDTKHVTRYLGNSAHTYAQTPHKWGSQNYTFCPCWSHQLLWLRVGLAISYAHAYSSIKEPLYLNISAVTWTMLK